MNRLPLVVLAVLVQLPFSAGSAGPIGGGGVWDCEAMGLTPAPGDQVLVIVNGDDF